MRFLADENIPLPSIRLLREAGHDVVGILEEAPGISDIHVLEHAVSSDRLLLTFDRDYGDLIYRQDSPSPSGILYLRFVPATPLEVGEAVLRLMETDLALVGQFTVVERDRTRQRPLPML